MLVRGRARNPVHIRDGHFIDQQCRMIVTRNHIKHIRRHVFTRHVPGIMLAGRFVVPLDDDYLDEIAAAFGEVIDSKSPYTSGHSARVALYADCIAAELGLGRLWVKDDGQNPTSSLKDRASAMAVAKASMPARPLPAVLLMPDWMALPAAPPPPVTEAYS